MNEIIYSNQTEKLIREVEVRNKYITEGLTDYHYRVRIKSGIAVNTMYSLGCVAVTGYTADEFTADPILWIQIVASEDQEMVREHGQKVLAGMDIRPVGTTRASIVRCGRASIALENGREKSGSGARMRKYTLSGLL